MDEASREYMSWKARDFGRPMACARVVKTVGLDSMGGQQVVYPGGI